MIVCAREMEHFGIYAGYAELIVFSISVPRRSYVIPGHFGLVMFSGAVHRAGFKFAAHPGASIVRIGGLSQAKI